MQTKLIPLYILVLAFIPFLESQAQQDPVYGAYMNNPVLINPAFSGLQDKASVNLLHRSQWTGMEAAPTTTAFSLHSSLHQNKLGGGLMVLHDQFGINRNIEIGLAYAYKIHFTNSTLSLGLQASYLNAQLNYLDLEMKDPDQLFNENQKISNMNFGSGAVYRGEKFMAALSIPRMLKTRLDEAQLYQPHMYLMLGGNLPLSHQLTIRPSTLLRHIKGAPMNFDLRADMVYNDIFMAGILSRSFKSYGFALGLFPRNFKIIYQFELPASSFIETGYNTHEISLGIDLNLFGFQKDGLKKGLFPF